MASDSTLGEELRAEIEACDRCRELQERVQKKYRPENLMVLHTINRHNRDREVPGAPGGNRRFA